MASTTPFQQVLATPELLEMILLRLGLKDLLFAHAVCMDWKAVIDRSPFLQKALFFQPATTKAAFSHSQKWFKPRITKYEEIEADDYFYLCSNELVEAVQMFERSRPNRFHYQSPPPNAKDAAAIASTKGEWEQLQRNIRNGTTKTAVFLNPLLLDNFVWFRQLFLTKDRNLEGPAIMARFDHQHYPLPCGGRQNASWRRMLISQPPLAMLDIDRAHSDYTWNNIGYKQVGTPLTTEALWELLRKSDIQSLRVEGMRGFDMWQDGTDLRKIGKG